MCEVMNKRLNIIFTAEKEFTAPGSNTRPRDTGTVVVDRVEMMILIKNLNTRIAMGTDEVTG